MGWIIKISQNSLYYPAQNKKTGKKLTKEESMDFGIAKSPKGLILLREEEGTPFFLGSRNIPKKTKVSSPFMIILKTLITGKKCKVWAQDKDVKTTFTMYWWWLVLADQLNILKQKLCCLFKKIKLSLVKEKTPKPKLRRGEKNARIAMIILTLWIGNIFLFSLQSNDLYAILILFFPLSALAVSNWFQKRKPKNWIAVSLGILGVEISMFNPLGFVLLPASFILRYWIKEASSPVSWDPEDMVIPRAKPHPIHFFDLIPRSLPEGKITRILAIINPLWWAQFIYGYHQGANLVGYTLLSTQLVTFSDLKVTLFGHEIVKDSIDLEAIKQSRSGPRSTWRGDCLRVDFAFAFGEDAESSVIDAARPEDNIEQAVNDQRIKLRYQIS